MTRDERPNGGAPARGASGIDLSLENWVLQLLGTTALVGKIEDDDEDSIRTQILADPTRPPCTTLSPVYILTSQQPWSWIPSSDQLPQRGLTCFPRQLGITAFGPAYLGRGAVSRLHVQLTAFEWLSKQPEVARRTIVMLIERANEAQRVSELGIVSAAST
jgi:hypothetical protein